ncbi:BTAD domain-containing putative transcriptional regulator [Saccharothrix deserti]|uniref:BTAD domain-containing putative transcriptional regulator n=1 Tax=Saccharothrix deserti TaxID=2593674 RepID=UPI00131B383B|nr:BTAD domain-containing putative transcriptional regulator [Saccharothrix deserti]
MTIDFKILGRVRLRTNDGFTDQWGTRKERGVLAVLLLNIGKAVPVRTLAEWVWSEGKAPRDPAATLSTYSTRIRNALKRHGLSAQLKIEDGAYRFVADPTAVDFHVFQRTMGEARRLGRLGNDERACELAESALALWDEPLADLDTERADNRRRVMRRDEWLEANNALIYGRYKLGEYEAALRLVKVAQVEYDLDVLLAKRRLEALYALERREEAVQYFLDYHHRAKAADLPERADELRRRHDELVNQDIRSAPHRRTTSAVPQYLPYDIDGFTGHEDLLATLDDLLVDGRKSRLIALDGQPGVGKTALAVYWAHRVRWRFPHGFWFVNLNGFGDGSSVTEEEVVAGLLEAVGVTPADCPPTTRARRAKLRDILSTRRLLVILDNAADAGHVEGLLPLLSGSVVVVTSRGRLSDLSLRYGARCFSVPPLGIDLARQWLRDRLGTRAEAEPDAVDRLARQAGGLPLMLGLIGENVAAQPGKPISDFVVQLRERGAILDLSANGSQAIVSLRAAIDCSYVVLSPPVRRLFCMLGLYPGLVFQIGVAAALTGLPPGDVLPQLKALVWARLLEPREGDRYAFHDLLRDYAAERVDRDETEEERQRAARRMLDWFLHTGNNVDRMLFAHREGVPLLDLSEGVRPLVFDSAEDAMDWCTRERAELTAVIDFAASNGFDEHVWRLSNAVGETMMRQGFKDELLQVSQAAIRAARSSGDRAGEGSLLCNLGLTYARFHEYREADECYRLSYDILREIGHLRGQATVLRNIGERRALAGDVPGALQVLDRALGLARQADDVDGQAGVLQRIGDAMLLGGRLHDAIVQLHSARSLRDHLNDEAGAGLALASLANAYHALGDHSGALGHAHQAMSLLSKTRRLAFEGQAATTAASVLRELEDLEEASFYAERAVDLCRQAHDSLRLATAQDVLAQSAGVRAGIRRRIGAGNWPTNSTAASVIRGRTAFALSWQSGVSLMCRPRRPPIVCGERHPFEGISLLGR